ncbi:MAG: hypothetical protein IJ679_10375 [Lachnospiraceae bacterium]|nr:hypothetical protein [Lachnospiraceae bacterium]
MKKEEIRRFLIRERKENEKSELEAYRALMGALGIGDVIESIKDSDEEDV